MSEADVMKASNTVIAYHNYWWCVHPTKGLMFWGRGRSAQANSNPELAERIRAKMYPWTELKQIPLVLVPINPSDYV